MNGLNLLHLIMGITLGCIVGWIYLDHYEINKDFKIDKDDSICLVKSRVVGGEVRITIDDMFYDLAEKLMDEIEEFDNQNRGVNEAE